MKIRTVLYLHRTQGRGVEYVHISGIANAFRATGCAVDVCSPAGLLKDGQIEKSADAGKGMSRLSRYTPELVFELFEMLYNFVALNRLRKGGMDHYDLIFERYAIFSFTGLLLARWKKIPLVLEVNYTSRSPLVRQRSRLLKPLAYALDKMLFRSATLLTPVSSALRDELIEVFGVAEEKIVVLANAVDPANFVPGVKACHGTGKIIGFVGGFYPWHGLDLLIDAFNMLNLSDAKIMLIGDGPELPRIRQKVDSLGLSDRVVFAGRVHHADLPSMMKDFYLGVMPDSNDYGSPMKIFEYMALGIPVVAPDYAPILDVMSEGRQGVVFKRGDVGDLAASLKALLQDASLAKSMGAAGRASVEAEYNWNANVAKITDALSRLGLRQD